MSLLKRIESLLMLETLGAGAAAAGFSDKTTGSHERSHGPSGGWNIGDNERVESIFTEALVAVEKLRGVVWKDERHVAKKHKPFDEREWSIHVLSNPEYVGKSGGLVAAEESVEEWSIRNLRRQHGFSSKGIRVKDCERRGCSICPAVSQVEA